MHAAVSDRRWPRVRRALTLALALGTVGCLPPDPDFGMCNRDDDCPLGRCVQGACLVELGSDGGQEPDRGALPDLGPVLACDAPVIPARERRSPCGRACEVPGFVEIEPGSFTMGSPEDEIGRGTNPPLTETLHEVTLTRGLWMKTHEVTVDEWQAMAALLEPDAQAGPSDGCDGPDCPVAYVNWFEALSWCNARSILEGLPPCYRLEGCARTSDINLACERVVVEAPDQNPLDCVGYRLPTEAEWEYATRAGTDTPFYSGPARGDGDRDPALTDIAWYSGTAGGRAHPIGQKLPNRWGLYDTLGNVREWVWDGAGVYRPAPVTDPLGAGGDPPAIMRGGDYAFGAHYSRSASRTAHGRGDATAGVGFRVARTRIVCGDGACSASESPESCPGDCPLAGYGIVPAGYDLLGSPDDEPGRQAAAEGEVAWPETRRGARINRSFWLKETEVTQAEWATLAGDMGAAEAPSAQPDCPRCPVERITWYDALAWCNAASRAEGLPPCYRLDDCDGQPGAGLTCVSVTVEAADGDPRSCEGYRLPTESEWEYAARAGAETAWHHGEIAAADIDSTLDEIGWYAGNADAPQPVGQKSASCWGFYDVAGNVHEWVWDAPGEYIASAVPDPILPPDVSVAERLVRGGAFDSAAAGTRAAARAERLADARDARVGFRPARTIRRPVTMPAWPLASPGPAGGLVFYDKGVFTNGWRYLEAAPRDLFGPWGCGAPGGGVRGDFIEGLEPRWIGSGRLDTPRIVAACDQPGIAAELADRLAGGGADDWFLPSTPTFEAIYEVLMRNGLGGFSTADDAFYWMSHQIDRDYADAWQVVERSKVAWNKNIPSWVRPVRAF